MVISCNTWNNSTFFNFFNKDIILTMIEEVSSSRRVTFSRSLRHFWMIIMESPNIYNYLIPLCKHIFNPFQSERTSALVLIVMRRPMHTLHLFFSLRLMITLPAPASLIIIIIINVFIYYY